MNNDMNVTQMQWRPALLRLTQVGYDGKPESPLFVDPSSIQKICIEEVFYMRPDGEKIMVVATSINCCHFHCAVTESPEMVAMLRDKALGHVPQMAKVV